MSLSPINSHHWNKEDNEKNGCTVFSFFQEQTAIKSLMSFNAVNKW
jgi:hypothetical protein